MDRPDPYADLKESLIEGSVVAFVGAGLSRGAGLPGWYELIGEMVQPIGYELPPPHWATSDALIEAAQAYINERGLHSLVMFLKERLDTTSQSLTAAHHALARLPISLVLTANYDDLLERAYREAGKRVQIVVQDKDIPFMRRDPDAVNIIKLYGDLNQPDTIVLAREQYEGFFLKRSQMIKLLETELGRSDVLYLGWSHTDPHFNLVFGELLSRFGDFMRPGYAVMFDLPEARRKELARKRIRLVQLDPPGDRTEQLAAWLSSLATGDASDVSQEQVSVPPSRSAPQPTSEATEPSAPARPDLQRVQGDGQLRYERGLEELEKYLKLIGGSDLEEFQDYSRQLLGNLQEEQRYGGDSSLTRERNKITGNLNRLTMRVLGESFNDFATGKLKCAGTTTTPDPLLSKLDAIHDEVKQQGEETRKSIRTLRKDILDRFDVADREFLDEIVAELNLSQASIVEQTIDRLESDTGNDRELQASLHEIQQALQQVQNKLAQIDHDALNEAAREVLAVISEPEISVRHKLKLTVPIIPVFLNYEGELELGQSLRLESAWNALRRKLGLSPD